MRFAAVQFDIAWEDKPANHARIEEMLGDAGIEPGTFILLPEMADTGFSFNLDRIVDDASLAWACRLARDRKCWVQAGYAARGPDGRGRNCASVVDPHGRVAGTYEKVHPFSYGNEIDHFSGGHHLTLIGHTELAVCPQICYDLRFPELWRLGARAGAEVFTIGACWPAARQQHWRALLIARAIENQAYVVACNRVGNDPHLAYAGGSMIVSPRGEVLAEAGDHACVLTAELDATALREWRATFPALKDMRAALLGETPITRDR